MNRTYVKIYFFYLNGRVIDIECGWGGGGGERSSIFCLTPQITTKTGARLGQSQKSSPEHLGYPSLISQAHLQGTGLEPQQPGLEFAPVHDASTSSRSPSIHHSNGHKKQILTAATLLRWQLFINVSLLP